jgi:hypothetical protein
VSRIELPGDNWVILWSPKKVKDRKRRRYMAAMADMSAASNHLPQIPNPKFGEPGQKATVPDMSQMTSEMLGYSDQVGDALILCLVRDWSFGEVTDTVLADLDSDVFDAVYRACLPLAGDLVPDYSPDPDPKVHTPGSPPSPPGSSMDRPTSEIQLSAVTS